MMSPTVLAQAKQAGDKGDAALKVGVSRPPQNQRWRPAATQPPSVPADETPPGRARGPDLPDDAVVCARTADGVGS
jgi:hypothetical protein